MNAVDVLRYGHGTVLTTLEGVPSTEWTTPGVCGVWSVKDIVAHLASYELALVDVLTSLTKGGPTPTRELRELMSASICSSYSRCPALRLRLVLRPAFFAAKAFTRFAIQSPLRHPAVASAVAASSHE